jgi:protein SCO1/2
MDSDSKRAVTCAAEPRNARTYSFCVFGIFLIFGIAALVTGTVTSCRETHAADPGRLSTFESRGIFKGFDPRNHQATISHDEIPGYMPAMTMNFEVRDSADLPGLQPGDRINFRLSVTNDNAWIERVRKLSAGPELPVTRPPSVNSHELNIGDSMPDLELTDQSSKQIHLRDFQGQVLALTFIYTRCPLPTYCPLMNRNFQSAQAILTRLSAGVNAHFLSITLDPEHDTPSVLAAYAGNYQADPAAWTFATAGLEGIRKVGDSIGLEFDATNGFITHNLRTVVIDANGRIRRIFSGNSWTPQELVAAVRSAESVSTANSLVRRTIERP